MRTSSSSLKSTGADLARYTTAAQQFACWLQRTARPICIALQRWASDADGAGASNEGGYNEENKTPSFGSEMRTGDQGVPNLQRRKLGPFGGLAPSPPTSPVVAAGTRTGRQW